MILEGYLDPLWLGTQQSLAQRYQTIVQARSYSPADWAALKKEAYLPSDAETSPFGAHSDIVTQVGSTAVVDISGSLTNTESWVNRYFGMLSYPKIRGAVSTAAKADGISQILLNVSSPGGQVTGISETVDFLKTVGSSVPIYTFAADMNSAAYWIGSVGKKVYTSDLSNVGSIGVIAVHREMTRLMDEMGITVTVLRQGKYKAIGNPFERLSDDAKSEIMSSMEKVYDRFKTQVADARGLPLSTADKWAEGRVFFGYEAVTNGLADAIMPIEKVLETIDRKEIHTASKPLKVGVSLKGEDSMTIKLTKQQQAALAEGASLHQVFSEAYLKSLSEEDRNYLESLAPSGSSVGNETDKDAQADKEVKAVEITGTVETVDEGREALADRLMSKIEKLQEDNAELKAQVKAQDQELGTLKSQAGQFKEIVSASINRMQVALGGASNQFQAGDDADTLLSMHARTKALFESRFPVGGRAEVKTNDQDSAEALKATYQPAVSAVRIRNTK